MRTVDVSDQGNSSTGCLSVGAENFLDGPEVKGGLGLWVTKARNEWEPKLIQRYLQHLLEHSEIL